jgi:Cyclin D1 binding domain
MINVTYHGDLLLAYKVTGDKNVPRGELTFQVDLSPIPPRVVGTASSPTSVTPPTEPLQPISLTEKAAKKWGTTQLPRHKGLGQVAEPGFTNNQWMDGQLIIIGEEYFSFAWVPIEQQIFFGRPSPELALKMLRESGASTVAPRPLWVEPPSMDADVKVLKEFVSSCLEKTAEAEEDELSGDSFSCIWSGMDAEECYFQ